MGNDRKDTHKDKETPNEPKDPVDQANADDDSEYPRRHTEQERDRQPGTQTREEIRTKVPRGKSH
jgi:hypothetical protein